MCQSVHISPLEGPFAILSISIFDWETFRVESEGIWQDVFSTLLNKYIIYLINNFSTAEREWLNNASGKPEMKLKLILKPPFLDLRPSKS